jgi:hypothetical protein
VKRLGVNLSDTKYTLKQMAKLSITSGKISEIHVKNLQIWPFVFFNGVRTVNIDYDLTTNNCVSYDTDSKGEIDYKFSKPITDHFHISYDLDIDETQDNSNLEKRFDALEKSVQTIFWAGIPLKVSFNGRNVYGSKKNG